MRGGIDRRGMATLSAGHLATDLSSGAVPALLPFFADRFDLSYTLTAVLMLCATASSSVVQPAFGLWSDRRGALWLLPGGVALAGGALGLAALAPSYGLALALVFCSGLGVAAFHPEGTKFAAYVSGRRRATGMSYFNIGGNSGTALAPVLATPLVLWLGLEGGVLLALPALAVAFVLARSAGYLRGFVPERTGGRHPGGEDRIGAAALLVTIIVLRSVAWFALLTFVPLWAVSLGDSEGEANRLLAVMLVSGAVGTLALGPLSDRIGYRRTLLLTQAALAPLMLVFVLAGGLAGTVALALVGACVVGTFGVTIVLSHQYLPQHVGVAGGLSVGLAIGLGGVAAVALGALADALELRTALLVAAAAPAAGALLCLLLPRPAAPPQLAAEAAAP